MIGRVTFLARHEGFGYLRGEDGKKYWFSHRSLFPGTYFSSLSIGHRVAFSTPRRYNGPTPVAVDVELKREAAVA